MAAEVEILLFCKQCKITLPQYRRLSRLGIVPQIRNGQVDLAKALLALYLFFREGNVLADELPEYFPLPKKELKKIAQMYGIKSTANMKELVPKIMSNEMANPLDKMREEIMRKQMSYNSDRHTALERSMKELRTKLPKNWKEEKEEEE